MSDEIVALDWRENPIYMGEWVFRINDDYVQEDDLQDYIKEQFGGVFALWEKVTM